MKHDIIYKIVKKILDDAEGDSSGHLMIIYEVIKKLLENNSKMKKLQNFMDNEIIILVVTEATILKIKEFLKDKPHLKDDSEIIEEISTHYAIQKLEEVYSAFKNVKTPEKAELNLPGNTYSSINDAVKNIYRQKKKENSQIFLVVDEVDFIKNVTKKILDEININDIVEVITDELKIEEKSIKTITNRMVNIYAEKEAVKKIDNFVNIIYDTIDIAYKEM